MKYRGGIANKVLIAFAGREFRTQDVLNKFGGTKENCWMLIYKMCKRGQLVRLKHGVYLGVTQ